MEKKQFATLNHLLPSCTVKPEIVERVFTFL